MTISSTSTFIEMNHNSLCDALNQFHLPRAIAHLHQDRFVAWNEMFLQASGLSGEEVGKVSLNETTTFDEPSRIAPDSERTAFTLVPFRLKSPDTDRVLHGNAARKKDGFVLFIVVPQSESDALESARKQGKDEEHERILKLFHDEAGPKLLAAVFTTQLVREELEARGLPESESVAKIGDQLVEAIDGVVEALEPEERRIEEQITSPEGLLPVYEGA